jgi:hypothetical protein
LRPDRAKQPARRAHAHPLSRATTASSAKNRAVAALTTTTPDQEIIMASSTVTRPAADARAPQTSIGLATSAILALDLGGKTGWALRSGRGTITSGVQLFRPNRFEGGGMAFLRFNHWLSELAENAGPITAVFFEEVRAHAGTVAAHVYGGFLAHLEAWAEFRDVPYQGVPVGTVKRYITGKGNADKQAVIAAVRERGFSPADDNEADAIAILLWAIDTHGGVR